MRIVPAGLLAFALVAAPPALADEAPPVAGNTAVAPPARCTLKVIEASEKPGGIDPQIVRLRPYLQKPPFSHWHSFKLLSQKEHEIAPGGTVMYPVPNGHEATATYTRHQLEPNGKHRVNGVFRVRGQRTAMKMEFTLDEGGIVNYVGEAHHGGWLIYSLSCSTAQ
jgi:hypothetical protein